MKKIKSILSTLVMMMFIFVLVACDEQAQPPKEKQNYDMSNISFVDKTITYDGNEHELTIAGELPEGVSVSYENNKMTNVGQITATAKFSHNNPDYNEIPDMTATLTITRNVIAGLSLNNKTVTYDGQEHSLLVEGELPTGAIVTYTNNNQASVGTYYVEATIADEAGNYEPLYLSATLTIEKADYDISNISFADKTIVYDGNEHELTITGELPEGVSVSYENNKRTNVGQVEARAIFTHNNSNYNEIPSLTATLTITKMDIENINFDSKTVVYDGNSHSLEIVGELPEGTYVEYSNNAQYNAGTYEVTATIRDGYGNYEPLVLTATLTIVPAKIEGVTFADQEVVYNGYGQSIYISGDLPSIVFVSYENQTNVDVGSYEVKATLSDALGNYEPLVLTATLTIVPAQIKGITFESQSFTYDGGEHSLRVQGEIPYTASVKYENNRQVNAGVYNVKAIVGDSIGNFIPLELEATLTIDKAVFDASDLKFADGTFTYTGYAHSIRTEYGSSMGMFTISYIGNEQTEAGVYEVIAVFTDTAGNYEDFTLTATMTINKADYDMRYVRFNDMEVDYDTREHEILIEGFLPEGVNVTYQNNRLTEVGSIEATAIFTHNNPNYNEIPSMKATLTIRENVFIGMEYVEYDNYIEITGYDFSVILPNTVIPSEYNGKPVTHIAERAFELCHTLVSVELPDTITYIGPKAFNYCTNLETINIPNGVTAINDSTFSRCGKLKNISFGDNLETIGSWAFSYAGLETLNLPNSVLTIQNNAFIYCEDLASVILSTALTSIASGAFSNCISLLSITLPESLEIIDYGAFTSCVSLENVSLNSQLLTLGDYAFSGCEALQTFIMPDSVTSIGKYILQDCSNLQEVVISKNVTSIQEGILMGANKVEKLSIPFLGVEASETDRATLERIFYYGPITSDLDVPETLREVNITNALTIGAYAFSECDMLTKVTINEGVTIIGEKAFYGCTGLTDITIPSSVLEIGANAFENSSSIREVTLNYGLLEIGSNAFYRCTNLESIIIPGSVQLIDAYAFDSCESLTSLEIQAGVKVIGTSAFASCNSLTSIVLEEGLLEIGDSAFNSYNQITNLIIPDSVQRIGAQAFYGCDNLVNLKVPFVGGSLNAENQTFSYSFSSFANLQTLEITGGNIEINDILPTNSITNLLITGASENVYVYGVPQLVNLTLANSIRTFGIQTLSTDNLVNVYYNGNVDDWLKLNFSSANDNPVRHAEHIFMLAENGDYFEPTEIVIREGVEVIAQNQFLGFKNVISYTLPKSLTHIEELAFYQNDSLETIYYSGNVDTWFGVSISGDKASPMVYANSFYIMVDGEYVELKNLVVPDGVTAIKPYQFYGFDCLESIYIPKDVTSINIYAFAYCSGLQSIVVDPQNPIYDSRNNCNAIIETATNTLILGCQNTVFPDDIMEIGSYAFSGCSNLTTLTIPESVKIISSSAFSYSGLINITINPTLEKLNGGVFADAINLENVYFNGSLLEWCGVELTMAAANPMIHAKNFYLLNDSGSYEQLTELVFGSNFNYISSYQFYNFDCLTSIEIGENVNFIGENPFGGCDNLESITVVKDNLVFDSRNNCNGIIRTESNSLIFGTNITTIPDTIIEIGRSAFYDCAKLTSITIPNSVLSIGFYAFYECTQLEEVYFNGTAEEWKAIKKIFDPLVYAKHIYILNDLGQYYDAYDILKPNTN